MNIINILTFLAIGLGLFTFFRLSGRFTGSLVMKRKSLKFILRILPIVEFLAWTVFVLLVLKAFFSDWKGYSLFTTAIVTIVLLTIAWYFLRDFIAGIIMKAENAFTTNQHIRTPEISGTIKKIGYRSLEVEGESGHFSKVPYSRIYGQIFSIQAPAETMLAHELVLQLPATQNLEDVKEQIVKELLLLPWVSVNHDPVIKTMQESGETITLKISYHTSNDSMASDINQHIRKRFEGK
jgi:small-conductance mechanosensitive channel